jgi:hypothetical protein
MKKIVLIWFALIWCFFTYAQNFSGIGIALKQGSPCAENSFAITVVKPNGPADKAGLKVGDCFWEVEGKQVNTINMEKLVNLLRGVPGTPVNISVKRAGEILSVTAFREQIEGSKITQVGEDEWKEKHMTDLHQYYMKVYRGLDKLMFESHKYFDNFIPNLIYFPLLKSTRAYNLNSQFVYDYKIDGKVDFAPFGKLDFNGKILPYVKNSDLLLSPLFLPTMNKEALHEMITAHLVKDNSWQVDHSTLIEEDKSLYAKWFIYKKGEKEKYHSSPRIAIELDVEIGKHSFFNIQIEPPFTQKIEGEIANVKEDLWLNIKRDPRRNRGPIDAESEVAKYCDKGDCISGESKLVIELKNSRKTTFIYEGNMKNGLADGKGKLTHENLESVKNINMYHTYEGNFKRGFLDGEFKRVTFNSAQGDKVEYKEVYAMGERKSVEQVGGKVLASSEKGVYGFTNEPSERVKCTYGDCMNGEASYTVTNPSGKTNYSYNGIMKDGLAHGKGVLFLMDYRESKMKTYRGNFVNGNREGKFEEEISGFDPLTLKPSAWKDIIVNEVVFAKNIEKSSKNISGMLKPSTTQTTTTQPKTSTTSRATTNSTNTPTKTNVSNEKPYDTKTFPGVIEGIKAHYKDLGYTYRSGRYLEAERTDVTGRSGRMLVLITKKGNEPFLYYKDGYPDNKATWLNKFDGYYPITSVDNKYAIGDFVIFELHLRGTMHLPVSYLIYRPLKSGNHWYMEFDK